MRLAPVIAGQPVPGSRLLQGIAVSRKYMQRVRCSRLPAVVAMLRSCADAPDENGLRQHGVITFAPSDGGRDPNCEPWRRSSARRQALLRSCRAANG